MKAFLITIIIFSSLVSFSQVSNKEIKRSRTMAAEAQIKDLKNGVLLIRLKTKQKTIAALKESGHQDHAKLIEAEVYKFNKSLMDAFHTNFDFCPVYFFPSDYSKYILSRDFDSLYFYGSDLKIDKSLRPDLSKFLVAEYGPIESDTTSYYSKTTAKRGAEGLEKKDDYYESGTYGFEALLIRSAQFVQLSDPFPYYVKTWDSTIKPAKVVKKMNKKLKQYYNEVH